MAGHLAAITRIAVLLLALGCAGAAQADEGAIGRGALESELLRYYGQERTTARLAGGVGIVAAASGGYLLTRPGDFSRGLGIPLLALGALEGIGAIFYVDQVDREIEHGRGSLARDPAAFRAEELAHLQGTTSRFTYYRAFELGLTAAGVGLATYGFASDRDGFKGVGVGLAALGLPLLVIDTFNDASAQRYLGALGSFDPSLAIQAGDRSGALVLSGRF